MAGFLGTIVKCTKEEVEATNEFIMAAGRLEDYKKTSKIRPALEQLFVKYDKVHCEYLRIQKRNIALDLHDDYKEENDSPQIQKERELYTRTEDLSKALARAIAADKTLPEDIIAHANACLAAHAKSDETFDKFEKKLQEKAEKN